MPVRDFYGNENSTFDFGPDLLAIDDYAKDGVEELLTKMHCVRITNP